MYTRRNGRALLVIAGSFLGLPYGKVPRLLLAHLVREYKRTGQRQIELARSFSGFLKALGMGRTGGKRGTMRRVRDQSMRLFAADIQSWDTAGVGDGWTDPSALRAFKRHPVVDEAKLWWDPASPDVDGLFGNSVVLSEAFTRSCERAVPVDFNALKTLQSSFSIDLYCWLTYRCGAAQARGVKQFCVSWSKLGEQFGHDYARLRDFRRAFKRALRPVIDIYPVQVTSDAKGIVVRSRIPHVARKRHISM